MGTGDGSYVIHHARKSPNSFFIGIDSNAENLCDNSRKTSIFSEKRGLKNALFVHAGIETLPVELFGFASTLTILLPWGSLLSAVAKPEISLLHKLTELCCKHTTIRIIFGYDHATEQKKIEKLGLPELTAEQLNRLVYQYSLAGLNIRWRMLEQKDIKNIPTTWAKKLAYGKKRQFVEIYSTINNSN